MLEFALLPPLAVASVTRGSILGQPRAGSTREANIRPSILPSRKGMAPWRRGNCA